MLQSFVQAILPVIIILGLGYLIGRFFEINTKTLSTLSLYLLTPALIFQALYRYQGFFQLATLKMFIAVTLIVILIIVLMEISARIFHIPGKVKTALILTLILSNSGNFGLLICQNAFGEEAFLMASVLLVIYSFYTNTVGVYVAARDNHGIKEAVKRTFSIPFFYAFVAALLLNFFKVQIPEPIFQPIKLVGLSAIPLNLIQLGINLASVKSEDMKGNWGYVIVASITKLAIIPVGAYFLLKLLGIQGLEFKVTMAQISMPPAVYCSILTAHYDGDTRLTSSIVFFSTLLSIVTLSILLFILA